MKKKRLAEAKIASARDFCGALMSQVFSFFSFFCLLLPAIAQGCAKALLALSLLNFHVARVKMRDAHARAYELA